MGADGKLRLGGAEGSSLGDIRGHRSGELPDSESRTRQAPGSQGLRPGGLRWGGCDLGATEQGTLLGVRGDWGGTQPPRSGLRGWRSINGRRAGGRGAEASAQEHGRLAARPPAPRNTMFGPFHKGRYGLGNLNTAEPELNWKQKSLSAYI